MTGPTFPDLRVRPFKNGFGAEILGVNCNAPLETRVFQAIERAFVAHQVLVFPDQEVSPGGQVAFARRFGEVQVHVMDEYHASEYPELYTLSNLDRDGGLTGRHPDRGTLHWHTDGSWEARPGLATFMFALEIPNEGGETHFCDMYGAWDRLDPSLRDVIRNRRAVHSLAFSRIRRHGEGTMTEDQKRHVPPVAHPMVRTHPRTHRRCIYLGDHAEHVEGMDYAEGRALIETVNTASVESGAVYRHRWKPGQLVMWDNRCVLHRATDYDVTKELRVIRRCTVIGDVPRP